VFENAATTYTFPTPGASTICTYAFNPPMPYDPEQPAEIRVVQARFEFEMVVRKGLGDLFAAARARPQRAGGRAAASALARQRAGVRGPCTAARFAGALGSGLCSGLRFGGAVQGLGGDSPGDCAAAVHSPSGPGANQTTPPHPPPPASAPRLQPLPSVLLTCPAAARPPKPGDRSPSPAACRRPRTSPLTPSTNGPPPPTPTAAPS
jgi:hypothetical protein